MSYSQLAPFYRSLERCTMGSALQRARTGQMARLASLLQPQRVLIVGEGDGSFLLTFVRQFPEAVITVVESSAGMVARAQARLRKGGLPTQQIEFVVQALDDAVLAQASYDLIVTLFFLDNFDEMQVRASIAKLGACASDCAYWLVSDFCLPAAGWRRWRARLWLKVLYLFFGYATGLTNRELPEIEVAMENTEFSLLARKSICGGLLFSALYWNIK